LTLAGDLQNEWQFAKSHIKQKVKIVPSLLIRGTDAMREAAVSGCGVIRLTAAALEDELRSGQLAPVLSDWECTGAPPLVAIYRKTRPMVPKVNVFVQHLAEAFRRYNA
jgi:DNA-binding transcriptional LysR family regulator